MNNVVIYKETDEYSCAVTTNEYQFAAQREEWRIGMVVEREAFLKAVSELPPSLLLILLEKSDDDICQKLPLPNEM